MFFGCDDGRFGEISLFDVRIFPLFYKRGGGGFLPASCLLSWGGVKATFPAQSGLLMCVIQFLVGLRAATTPKSVV